jgi:hypothetical protein
MKGSNTGNWGQSCNSDGSCNAPYQCVGGLGGKSICCMGQQANQPESGGTMCCPAASDPNACATALCGSVQCEGVCYNGECCPSAAPCTGGWGQSCNSDGSCNAPYQCVIGLGGKSICCIDPHANQSLSGGKMCCAAASDPTACATALCGSVQCQSTCYGTNEICCDDCSREGCGGAPCSSGDGCINGICCESSNICGSICCPSTQSCSNGLCCNKGLINSNGVCCKQGESGSAGVCYSKCGPRLWCPDGSPCLACQNEGGGAYMYQCGGHCRS